MNTHKLMANYLLVPILITATLSSYINSQDNTSVRSIISNDTIPSQNLGEYTNSDGDYFTIFTQKEDSINPLQNIAINISDAFRTGTLTIPVLCKKSIGSPAVYNIYLKSEGIYVPGPRTEKEPVFDWKDLARDKPVCSLQFVGDYTVKIKWDGFYNNKKQKKEDDTYLATSKTWGQGFELFNKSVSLEEIKTIPNFKLIKILYQNKCVFYYNPDLKAGEILLDGKKIVLNGYQVTGEEGITRYIFTNDLVRVETSEINSYEESESDCFTSEFDSLKISIPIQKFSFSMTGLNIEDCTAPQN